MAMLYGVHVALRAISDQKMSSERRACGKLRTMRVPLNFIPFPTGNMQTHPKGLGLEIYPEVPVRLRRRLSRTPFRATVHALRPLPT